MIHVYPVNDNREHLTDGRECPCNPAVEYINPATGEPHEGLTIHKAWDLRDAYEDLENIPARETRS